MQSVLLENIDKLHTTQLGIERIRKNLNLISYDVVTFCKMKIADPKARIILRGKNWYIYVDRCVLTVNSYSYTIITAHQEKVCK